jgi:hypothetical protein
MIARALLAECWGQSLALELRLLRSEVFDIGMALGPRLQRQSNVKVCGCRKSLTTNPVLRLHQPHISPKDTLIAK